jgi:hypothetical protein
VPLAVAFRGIDRYCERLALKGGRRRPVLIEFCEPDILDIFDDWRRSVGIVQGQAAGEAGAEAGAEAAPARKPALTAHLERVVARLVGSRAPRSPAFERHVEALLAEIDRLSAESRKSRGDARASILDRLAELDKALLRVAADELDGDTRAAARREAEAELAPFGARLSPEMRAEAIEAAFDRLVRETLGLPTIRYQ